ncbi:hypothetical protein POL58_33570 [Nannocystis sp. ncelm1]|uniref:Uncharacterized protein n=2 Tax=Nannocystis radixulma TaxID=2995305 RepID=A0ABT5BGH9_9BACT|nr:hypothetical protein [Nannocystis radixulma]
MILEQLRSINLSAILEELQQLRESQLHSMPDREFVGGRWGLLFLASENVGIWAIGRYPLSGDPVGDTAVERLWRLALLVTKS